MNICGVLVHAHPDRLAAVRAGLAEMPGVDVHAETPEGRLVVTVEEHDGLGASERLADLHKLRGVLSAALVYHHHEPDAGTPNTGTEE